MKKNLTVRNHELDDLFDAKTLVLQEKKKKSDDDDDSVASTHQEHSEDDGLKYVEKVGVNIHYFSLGCIEHNCSTMHSCTTS